MEEPTPYNGVTCPNTECGSRDIEAGTIQADGSTAWSSVKCNDCGATWRDVYSLKGHEALKTPQQETP